MTQVQKGEGQTPPGWHNLATLPSAYPVRCPRVSTRGLLRCALARDQAPSGTVSTQPLPGPAFVC